MRARFWKGFVNAWKLPNVGATTHHAVLSQKVRQDLEVLLHRHAVLSQRVLQDLEVLLHHRVVLSQKILNRVRNQEVHPGLAPRNAPLVLTGERQLKNA